MLVVEGRKQEGREGKGSEVRAVLKRRVRRMRRAEANERRRRGRG